ncbi:MAG TPA: hypothetical protein VFO78_12330 [Candidatus Limnocylindrales bacterium]|nr:hypothetical protein [Candidatus Limnocylindrales bacterium]
MSDREPQIFEVAPAPLGSRSGGSGRGPGRSRRPSSVAVVLVIALAVPLVAFVGPRIEWRPQVDLSLLVPSQSAEPQPTPTRRPRVTPLPTSSPPPPFTAGEGPLPARLAIDVGGIRLVDPATGRRGPPGSIRLDSDAVVPADDGGWWCVCFRRSEDFNKENVAIDVRHLDASAIETGRWPLEPIESSAAPPAQDFYTRIDVEFAPDRRTAYLAIGTRSGDRWTIWVEAIDVIRGVSLGRERLADLDIPEADAGTTAAGFESYLAGPLIRLSPDGRRMTVVAWIERYVSSGRREEPIASAWLLDLPGTGAPNRPFAAAAPLEGDLGESIRSCWLTVTWLSDEELLASCWQEARGPGGVSIALRTFGLDGVEHASVEYAADDTSWTSEPLIDRANRTALFWSPVGHYLDVVDLAHGAIRRVAVQVEAIGRPVDFTSAHRPAVIGSFISDYRPWFESSLVADPAGSRLYALGMRGGAEPQTRRYPSGSTGVWVMDATTLEVLAWWPPAGPYVGLGLSRDGDWLTAIGQAGVDTDGNDSAWPFTVSVHDTSDGRLALQIADIAEGFGVFPVP